MTDTSDSDPDDDPTDGTEPADRTDGTHPASHLDDATRGGDGTDLTTDHGVGIPNTEDSLTAGERGPTLMEDFHFREKMTHFDHESIPERVVHARGTGAHGYFQAYEDPDLGSYDDISALTSAGFLTDPDRRTPVFVRFSTVVGSRGSADTVRDVRGFATKFYTEEGTFDLVGNNIPIFFIQDAMEFPDLVHAIKPEPDDGVPQASAAHDTFWDFASVKPELAHMLMWVLSGRALPRAYRMMQGFGVHTFRLVNDAGESRFVKFHWTPTLGTHQLVWDETQKIAGKNPDFNRDGLYSVLEDGYEPAWELGIQVVEEDDADRFDFDLLDPTKIIPETEVPVHPIGELRLTDPPENFFAEVEQVAFHPGNVVPGIDFSNDPLLQGRLFSYQDTQLNRFNSANWDELPINRPVAERDNNQRAGFMRRTIDSRTTSYKPNSIDDDAPDEVPGDAGGYEHYAERIDGRKIRERSDSFEDHFSQARLFWNSMAEHEQDNIVDAARFELGKVDRTEIRERMVHEIFNNIDHEFAKRVAAGIGVEEPSSPGERHPDHDAVDPSLSLVNRPAETIETRKVAVLIGDGVDAEQVEDLTDALTERGARVTLVGEAQRAFDTTSGGDLMADESHATTASVVHDAVVVPGGDHLDSLVESGDATHFVAEAFSHKKPIGAIGTGIDLVTAATGTEIGGGRDDGSVTSNDGIVTTGGGALDAFVEAFADAVREHRHWERDTDAVPA